LSSVGDWLGLMATGLFAGTQFGGSAARGAAFGGVVLVQLLPALVLGPLSGVVSDRWDRRRTMVVCDVLRFVLYASIPAAPLLLRPHWTVLWALVATFLAQVCAMVWAPAKEAAVPNLVPGRLQQANQVSLVTTYGVAPVLAALVLAVLGPIFPNRLLQLAPVQVALYFNALTFLAAAIVVAGIPGLGRSSSAPGKRWQPVDLLAQLVGGLRYAWGTRMLRGLLVGIVGAFAAGGVVVGAAPLYAASLGGGQAAFGLLFAALFIGLGLGIVVGPRLVGDLSRYRWFGVSVLLAGSAVATLAIAPHLALAVAVDIVVGVGAGMAFLSGTTLLGAEVEDAMRGRMFAFVQTAVRVVLMFATAAGALLAGIGGVRSVSVAGASFQLSASRGLLVGAGALACGFGYAALRLMDDRRGTPLLPDLVSAVFRTQRRSQLAGSGLLVLVLGDRDQSSAAQLHHRLGAAGYDSMLVDAGDPNLAAVAGHPAFAVALPECSRAASLLRLATLAQAGTVSLLTALNRGAAVIVHGLRYPVNPDGAWDAAEDSRRLLAWTVPNRVADAVVIAQGTACSIRHWNGPRQIVTVARESESAQILGALEPLLIRVAVAASIDR
jgi:dTMP kinase